MIVCSMEGFEECFDKAAASAAAQNIDSLDPASSRYLSDEFEHLHSSMESHVDEINSLLAHINQKGGVNRQTAEKINVLRPGFINPARPLATFTTDYTRTNFVASQEGLLDTLKTFKDGILKALAALLKKFTDWVVNVFKSWRKENETSKETLDDAETALKQLKEAYAALADSFNAVGSALQSQVTGASNTAVTTQAMQIIQACKLDAHGFEHLSSSPQALVNYFIEYQDSVIKQHIQPKMNAFLAKLINQDADIRAIIQKLVLDVHKRLPEITNRMEVVNRTLAFHETFTAQPPIHSQELTDVAGILSIQSGPIDVISGDIESAVETMLDFPVPKWFDNSSTEKLINADLMLDVLSGLDISYMKQIPQLTQKGRHLEGIMNSMKGDVPEGLREMMIDLSQNISSINRVMNIVRVMTLSTRNLVMQFDLAVEEVCITVKKIGNCIVRLPATAAVEAAVEAANRAVAALPM